MSPDHFIGGKRVSSPTTFEVRSPLDWDWLLAEVARGDPLTADQAVSAAVDAFPGWAGLTPAQRAEPLHRLADLIDANIAMLARVECIDMAMLLESLEAGSSTAGRRTSATMPISLSPIRAAAGRRRAPTTIERMPAGLPWSSPPGMLPGCCRPGSWRLRWPQAIP